MFSNMLGTEYWIGVITILIIGTIMAVIYFSKRTHWHEKENKKINENNENIEILREQWASGKIDTEKFDELSKKFNYKKKRKRQGIIVLIILCIIIGAIIAFSEYTSYNVHCGTPDPYSWWNSREYFWKCGSS